MSSRCQGAAPAHRPVDAPAGPGHLAPRRPGRDDRGHQVLHQVTPPPPASSLLRVIRQGFRHIDCAYCYGNEKEVGVVFKEMIGEGKFIARCGTAVLDMGLELPGQGGDVPGLQAVEHGARQDGRGAGLQEGAGGPGTGLPGPLPNPLAQRLHSWTEPGQRAQAPRRRGRTLDVPPPPAASR